MINNKRLITHGGRFINVNKSFQKEVIKLYKRDMKPQHIALNLAIPLICVRQIIERKVGDKDN